MEKILFIIIVVYFWRAVFGSIYRFIATRIDRSTAEEKPNKQLTKALKEYEKVCDRYNEKSAIYQAMADNLPHDDNEKSELKMAVEFAKLESKYQKMVNVRQAIIDTYGVDPGDEDGYKVSL